MEFAYSDKVAALQDKLRGFMDRHVYPNEARHVREIETGPLARQGDIRDQNGHVRIAPKNLQGLVMIGGRVHDAAIVDQKGRGRFALQRLVLDQDDGPACLHR